MTTLLWFRQDLRLRDNPALVMAAERGPVVPIYILDTSDPSWAPGAAGLWWLHHSLVALRAKLGALSLFKGDPRVLLPAIARESGASTAYWNRCYEPHAIARDTDIKALLKQQDIDARSFNAALLHEPWEIETGGGGPFKVFTPYWRVASAKPFAAPLPAPSTIDARAVASSDSLDDWRLLPIAIRIGPPAGIGYGRRARRARSIVSRLLSAAISSAMARSATARICNERRGCRHICIGVKFRPGKLPRG